MRRYELGIIGMSVLFLVLVGCATNTTREYEGPAFPPEQTALIESGPYTHIESIDGRNVRTLGVSVLPGQHTVTMSFAEQEQPIRSYLFYSWVTGSVVFDAQAGHRYLVYVDLVPSRGPADEEKGSGYVWIGHVLDRTTRKKVASTGPLPLGVEPRQFPGDGFGVSVPTGTGGGVGGVGGR